MATPFLSAERGSGRKSHDLPHVVEDALSRISRDARLTPTLEARLVDIALGLTYEEIARKHELSPNTVKTEVRFLLQHLGLTCRHEIEDGVMAAQNRGQSGCTAEELYEFLRLRFE